MLNQLSYQANWDLVVMWVNDKPVDDGYRCIPVYDEIHEFHVWLELRIEINVYLPAFSLKNCEQNTHSFQFTVLIRDIHILSYINNYSFDSGWVRFSHSMVNGMLDTSLIIPSRIIRNGIWGSHIVIRQVTYASVHTIIVASSTA